MTLPTLSGLREILRLALPIIASRLPDLARDGHVEWRPFPGVWGLKSLPVRTGKAA